MSRWWADTGARPPALAQVVARRVVAQLVLALALALALMGCAADDEPELVGPAAEGRSLVLERGCVSCHGRDGAGGVAPSWVGLHGSIADLQDGSTVVADRDYLVRSILDPSADIRAGYTLMMPPNNLTEAEAEAVAAYIEELG